LWAASRGEQEAVELLLKAGADLNLRNRGGYTALMIAEFNQYPAVVQMLRSAGAQS